MVRLCPRQSEYALGDDVALDLARTAGDRVGERREEALHEAAVLFGVTRVGERARRTDDLHAEFERGLAGLRARYLHVRVLRRAGALGEAREALVTERAQA